MIGAWRGAWPCRPRQGSKQLTKYESKVRAEYAAGTIGFIQKKEIAKHVGGFEGWLVAELARIEKQQAARNAWVAAEAAKLIK